VACFRRSAELKPDVAEMHNNLGSALMDQGKVEDAQACYRQALGLKPDLADAHSNLGAALDYQGRLVEAVASYRRALALDPALAEARHNLAMALLRLGEYEEGWTEYESRFALRPLPVLRMPRWEKTRAAETILLHCEQGYGDTLQFVRYARLARERTGARNVILSCPPELSRLLAWSCGAEIEVVAPNRGNEAAVAECDSHLPLLSLPLALEIFEPLTMTEPYLHADPRLRASWKERLGSAKELRVGLAWKGRTEHKHDRLRSLTWARFLPLLKSPGVRIYSLQIGVDAAELAGLTAAGVTDCTPWISDFADTAALADELDLIISVDTSIVHLAGGLGRPVWTLLPFAADWRWGMEGESTPWYPTMRLFRQPARGDWDPVLRRVAEALVGMANDK
jgi:hypothetical protein